MRILRTVFISALMGVLMAWSVQAENLTIATVNNGDMIRMQKLTDDFTKPATPSSGLLLKKMSSVSE